MRSLDKWTPLFGARREIRPCMLIRREETSNDYDPFLYTVQILNRPTLGDEAEFIPQGRLHYVNNVPRRAIVFSDTIYESDQHLEGAFRHEIGLGDVFPEKWKDLL